MVQTCYFDQNTRNLTLPFYFKEYAKSFGTSKIEILRWICKQLPSSHMRSELMHIVRAMEAMNDYEGTNEPTRIKFCYTVFRYDFVPRFLE